MFLHNDKFLLITFSYSETSFLCIVGSNAPEVKTERAEEELPPPSRTLSPTKRWLPVTPSQQMPISLFEKETRSMDLSPVH